MNLFFSQEKDQRGQPKSPGPAAVLIGWHSLSASGKCLFILLVGLLATAFLFSQWERQQPLMMVFYLLTLLVAAGNYLRARVLPQLTARSLLADLSVKDSQICIAGFSFPGAVQKLVLGKQSKKGPAFLQLAWNGSELWLFPLDELPQVEQFIRQHAPHIEIISE